VQKKETTKALNTYYHFAEPFLKKVIEDEKAYEELKADKFSKAAYTKLFESTEFLSKETLEFVVRYARNFYDRGEYEEALKVLNTVVNLIEDEDTVINVLWGKLHSEFLLQQNQEAHEDIKLLRTKIDAKVMPSHLKLAQRVFLMHTALFLYLGEQSTDADFDSLVELLTNEHYMNAIQVSSPHLTRYLAATLLLLKNNTKSKSNLNTLIPVFNADVSDHNDNITEFAKKLFGEFDFKNAQLRIKKFGEDLANDFFLSKRAEQLVNNAHTLYFEAFCKVYRKVEIKMVAECLGVPQDEAEVWIVNLIRNANMDAKIDLEKGVLLLTAAQPLVYEQILTKTRDLIPRTTILINNISKILKSQVQES